MKEGSYVTPELLTELNIMLTPEVPKGFFDDFTEDLEQVLAGADLESFPDAVVSVEKLTKAKVLTQAEAARQQYHKELRRQSGVVIEN